MNYMPPNSAPLNSPSPQGLYGAMAKKKQPAAPMGLMSQPTTSYASPNSSGQYTGGSSSRARPAPVAQPGPVQRTGNQTRHPAPKPAPKGKGKGGKGKGKGPAVPSVDQFLAGDSTYQGQYSSLQKALDDQKNQYNSQTGIVNQDFATALQKLQDQRTQDLQAMQNDYAARGLLNSGLYTDALGQYDTKYQQQYGELGTDQQRSLADLLSSLNAYSSENTATLSAAKQDAIRRRAAQYGIS